MIVRQPDEIETVVPGDPAGCVESPLPAQSATVLEMLGLLCKIERLAQSLRQAWDKQLRKSIPNINAASADVILRLGRCGAASQIGLAQLLGLSQMSVSRFLDHLESLGLVQRQPVTSDRRAWAVRLTQNGREVLLAVHAARTAFLQQGFSAIDGKHMATLVAMIALLEAMQAGAFNV
jgi:DNA-binding MarR family transcriptional regulator